MPETSTQLSNRITTFEPQPPINDPNIKCASGYTGFNFGTREAPIRMCLAAANNVCNEVIKDQGGYTSTSKMCNSVCPDALVDDGRVQVVTGPRAFTIPGGSDITTIVHENAQPIIRNVFPMNDTNNKNSVVSNNKNSVVSNQLPNVNVMICSVRPLS